MMAEYAYQHHPPHYATEDEEHQAEITDNKYSAEYGEGIKSGTGIGDEWSVRL